MIEPTLERVRLRSFVIGDAVPLAALCEHWPHHGGALWHDLPFAFDTAEAYLDGVMRATTAGCCLAFAIEDAVDGWLMGEVRLDLPELTLGYWLAPSFRGHGYMRAILREFLERVRHSLGEVKVTADVVRENLTSRRVLEDAGFRFQYLHSQDGVPFLGHATLLRYARTL